MTTGKLAAENARLREENHALRGLLAAVSELARSVPQAVYDDRGEELKRAARTLITLDTVTDPAGTWAPAWVTGDAAEYLRARAAEPAGYEVFAERRPAEPVPAPAGSCPECGEPGGWHRAPCDVPFAGTQSAEPAQTARPHCGARWPNRDFAGGRWTCTLDRGHEGDHEAGTPADDRPFYSSASQDDDEVTWDEPAQVTA